MPQRVEKPLATLKGWRDLHDFSTQPPGADFRSGRQPSKRAHSIQRLEGLLTYDGRAAWI